MGVFVNRVRFEFSVSAFADGSIFRRF
jgi:hypothetical protein